MQSKLIKVKKYIKVMMDVKKKSYGSSGFKILFRVLTKCSFTHWQRLIVIDDFDAG